MLINNIFIDFPLIYRGVGALITSVILTIFLGKIFIKIVNYTQPIREDGPNSHLTKKNTITYGGLLIIITYILSLIVWCNINKFVLIIVFCGLSFAIIGLVDDTLKLAHRSSKGLSGVIRLFFGALISIGVGYFLKIYYPWELISTIYWPFFIKIYIPISWLFLLWIPFVITGTSNSVNLTDGLDGLASIIVATVSVVFLFITIYFYKTYYCNSPFENYDYLKPFLDELVILILAFIGSLIGFLWYNCYPAKIFMGDVGSLFLGGTLGSLAIVLKYELVLALSGMIFIFEALSVIFQVYIYKFTKRRVFLMAPIHHHFEKMGLKESTIVTRFWIFTIIMSSISLLICF